VYSALDPSNHVDPENVIDIIFRPATEAEKGLLALPAIESVPPTPPGSPYLIPETPPGTPPRRVRTPSQSPSRPINIPFPRVRFRNPITFSAVQLGSSPTAPRRLLNTCASCRKVDLCQVVSCSCLGHTPGYLCNQCIAAAGTCAVCGSAYM